MERRSSCSSTQWIEASRNVESKQISNEKETSGLLLFLALLDSDISIFITLWFYVPRSCEDFYYFQWKKLPLLLLLLLQWSIQRAIFLKERNRKLEIRRIDEFQRRFWNEHDVIGNSESIILWLVKSSTTRVQSIQGIPRFSPSFFHRFATCM